MKIWYRANRESWAHFPVSSFAASRLLMVLACYLHVLAGGCLDYMKVEEDEMLGENYRFPPRIDAKYISPQPSRLINPIPVGKNCKGQVFIVPPIEDRNTKDSLYFLWFLDDKLAAPEATIAPEARKNAILTLVIDEQFLLSHFEHRTIPPDFYNRLHVINFYVSDRKYTIPESRLSEDATTIEKDHSDVVYWLVSFSNQSC